MLNPGLKKIRVPLTINPFFWYIDNSQTEFTNLAYGLRAIMSYRWFRRIKIQSLAEWNQSTSVGEPGNPEELYQEARKIGAKLTWDQRDNFFYPHRGFKLVVEPQMVGYFLRGDNNYLQLLSSFSSYWNLFGDLVFAHNINVAVAAQQQAGEDGEIPRIKRFYLGGNSSIRGFDQQQLGPFDEDGPSGGKLRLFTNFELRFPVYEIFGATVFLDVGNLWPEIEDANISDLEMAVGMGLTIDTPIGPARIDYGIPLGAEHANKGGQIHIAIAYAF